MPSFRQYDQSQGVFRTIRPDDLLESEHPARIVSAVVERLDLSELYAAYSEEGNTAYHPKMMLKVLFYGMVIGTVSSRGMWKGLKDRADFIFLSGDQVPDFRTLNSFRLRHIEQLDGLFAQIVVMCSRLGMIGWKELAVDGQMIKASASVWKSKNRQRCADSYERVKKGMRKLLESEGECDEDAKRKKRYQRLSKQAEALEKLSEKLETLEATANINMTDEDARVLKHKDGRRVPSYNNQSAVDGKCGVTVACRTRDDSDRPQDLFEIVDQAVACSGARYEYVLADAGFCDFQRLEEAAGRIETVLMPDRVFVSGQRGSEKRGPYGTSHFEINTDGTVRCPKGYLMAYQSTQKDKNGNRMAIYRGTECLRCEAKPLCTKNAKHRRISVNEREPYRQKMRAKLKTPDGRETYMRRQAIIEPLHGDDQKNRGWIQHALRGRAKAAGEFLLMRIGTNLRKMCRFQAAAVLAMD